MNMQFSQGRDVISLETNLTMFISTVLNSVKAGSIRVSTWQYFLAWFQLPWESVNQGGTHHVSITAVCIITISTVCPWEPHGTLR